MFERFTQEAKAVIVEARDVAIELGTGSIGPGHILYGCAETREGTAGVPLRACGITGAVVRRGLPRSEGVPAGAIDRDALQAIGIDYEQVRVAVGQTFGEGALESAPDRRISSAKPPNPSFTPQAKRSLRLALRIAVELHDLEMRPGHLLLGLLQHDDDFIAGVVQQSSATPAALAAAVLERVDTG